MKGNCIYNLAAVLPIFKHSYNQMLDHSKMSHDIAEQHDVERLEQPTNNSNIQVLKGGKFVFDSC